MNLATKQDFLQLEQKIVHLEQSLRRDMAMLEQRMTIKLGSIVSLAIGVAVALAKLIH